MNNKFIILIAFLILISIAGVSAGDVNQADSDSGFDKDNSECCSFVIQEEDGTVFAFRQDSPLNGRGVIIHNDTINGTEFLIEEIDPPNHFIHAMISEDGWIASHGGDSDNVSDTLALENLATEMILTKNISSDSLGQIQKIFEKYSYGHFFIKDPDGNYAAVYYTGILYGTLKPGEFLIISNENYGFRKGNATEYGIDPVDEIIEINSYENTGWNKRDLYCYEYKPHDTPYGQNYGVNIYAANDNGLNTGLYTSEIVTHVTVNGEYYPPTDIPQYPDKMYLGTYIFDNQHIDSVFELLYSEESVLVNSETCLVYKVNNLDDQRTVVLDFGDDVEYVDANVTAGYIQYDPTRNILYWSFSYGMISNNALGASQYAPSRKLSASYEPKEIILAIKPKSEGFYTVHAYVQGMDEELDVTGYATEPGVVLTSEGVTTYKTYYRSLDVYLTDNDGAALIGEKVSIMIDGTEYWRVVTPEGYASLAITMQPGEYDAVISYDGKFGESQTTTKIIVKPTIFADDLEIYYGDDCGFNISFLDENGEILAGYSIDYSLDGTLKNQLTDGNGVYSIPTGKLTPGIHNVTSYNGRTNEFTKNTITVKEPVCDLSVEKTVNASSIHIGDSIKWTVNVANKGPCVAHEVVATDKLPSNLQYLSYDANKGVYDAESGEWTIGNLTKGESATLYLYCIALKEGNITNEVKVTSNETEINPSDNQANSTVEVIKNETAVVAQKSLEQQAEAVKMLASGNPVAYIIVAVMILFASFWIEKR